MAPHSSTLAWTIPWMEEPDGLHSMGLLRVGHDWATSLLLSTFMHCRRKWQPAPVFLPGESQGQGSLVGCSPWLHRVGHDWSDLVVVIVVLRLVVFISKLDSIRKEKLKACFIHEHRWKNSKQSTSRPNLVGQQKKKIHYDQFNPMQFV